MGVLDSVKNFFGGGGSTSSAYTMPTLTPEQMTMLQQLIGQASSQAGQATPTYPGMTYVPWQQPELDYMNYDTSGRQAALGKLMSGTPAYDVSREATQDYWNKTMRPVYEKNFQETTMPMLAESFAGPSYWSSARADQTRQAITDYGQQLSGAESELYYNDELARRTAMENAFSRMAPGVGLSMQDQEAMGSAGAYARSVEQERMAGELQRWLSGESVGGQHVDAYNPNTQLMLSLLGISPYAIGQNTDTRGPGLGYSMLSGFAQGAGKGAGTMMMGG